MKLARHPFWLVGFRPFFTLACIAGGCLPALWTLVFLGALDAPRSPVAPQQWHAHEMFFGFGWAVLGGFLLTSTKNWVQIRGFHGKALIMLFAAWIFERAGMWWGAAWPGSLFLLSNTLFLLSIVAMLLWTLLRHRRSDSYRDNYFFLLILPTFLLAKLLMLGTAHFALAVTMATGLFRVAFLVMLERTLTQFMQSAFQVSILRHAALDKAIKLLALVLVFAGLLPAALAAGLSLLLAVLLCGRLYFWHPRRALQRLDIGIMYLGYIGIALQLLVEFADPLLHPRWLGAFSVHLFALGVMGLIVPAMLIRISKGHTGRKVTFDRLDTLALWLMIAALLLRVLAPQLLAAGYPYWIGLAAACWAACFGLLGGRYVPFLLQPRVDGKEH